MSCVVVLIATAADSLTGNAGGSNGDWEG